MKQCNLDFGLLDVVRNHNREFPLNGKVKTSLKRKIRNELGRMRTTVILNFEGGCKYYASIGFLSRISDFFDIVLNNPYVKNTHHVIDLEHTDSKMFSSILMLTSMIEEGRRINYIRKFNAKELMDMLNIASFYQITIVVKPLTKILFERINDENICYVYEFLKFRIPKISEMLEKIISSRMELLIKNGSAFLYLKQDSFLYFIFNSNTSIPLYTELFLLRLYVKLGQSMKRDVREIVNEQKKILNNSKGCYKIHDIRIPSKLLITIGGYSPLECPKVTVYNSSKQEWHHAPEKTCCEFPKLFYHKCIQKNRDIYIVGGCNENNHAIDTLLKWNLDNFKLTSLPQMVHRRNFLSAGLYDNEYLYALGGFNGRKRLKSMEIFDIHQQYWKFGAEMNFSRSDGTSVSVDDKIFAIGGYNGEYVENSVEYYNHERDKWFIFGSPMNHNRRGLSAVSTNNCIYAVGGFNTKRLNSFEMMDTREGEWHFLAPMFNARSNFSMSIFDNDICALGGCDQFSMIIGDCEKYDIVAGKWEMIPPLKYHLSAHSSIILEYDTAISSLLNYNF